MTTHAAEKRVFRSQDMCVGGVCAGLAERYDVDPIVVRILAVFITIMTFGLGAVAYAVLWARLPRVDESAVPYEVTPESAESNAFGCVDCTTGRATGAERETNVDGVSLLVRLAVAVCLVLLFLIVATNLAPLMPGTEWWQFWPVGLLIAGLCLIIIPIPTPREMAWHAVGIVITSLAAMLLPMALGIMSWNTLPCAFAQAWPAVLIALGLFAFGAYRCSGAFVVAGAIVFVLFCVYALTACAIPGDLETLLLYMPDGRFLRISIIPGS